MRINYSSKFFIKLRDTLRKLGLLPLFEKIYKNIFIGKEYEGKFIKKIKELINNNNCIWDIGANVGFYTKIFDDIANDNVKIITFEPSPNAYSKLNEKFKYSQKITNKQIALSSFDGTALYECDNDSPTNKIIEASYNNEAAVGKSVININVAQGDTLIKKGEVPVPNIIKIDVEGHELHVLLGMKKTLSNHLLRAVFIEIHFSLLKKMSPENSPAKIVALLESSGFIIEWTDISHLYAFRKNQN